MEKNAVKFLWNLLKQFFFGFQNVLDNGISWNQKSFWLKYLDLKGLSDVVTFTKRRNP